MTDQKTPRSLPLSEAITIAAQAVSEVMSGRSLTEVLDQLEAHERPIVQSLSFDALRKWVRSHEFIKQFIPKTPPTEVDHLLSVAIALFLQDTAEGKGYPAHTIVDQAVKACGEYDPTMYAKGLVNAVLRKVSLLIKPPEGEKHFPPDPIPMYVPAWWRANLKRNYSKAWQSILFQQAKRAPFILAMGGEAYLKLGKPNNGGTKIFSVSGDVNRPGNYEIPMGLPFAELLQLAGGMRNGSTLKAVIPGGSSAPVIPAAEMMDLTMDYDSIAKAGSMLGSGAVIVMNDTRCMVQALLRLSYFYHEESCGQCTPCREGTGWLWRIVNRIEHGKGRIEDLDLLNDVANNIQGRTICALGDAAAMPVRGMLKHFRDEFAYHIEHGRCLVSKGVSHPLETAEVVGSSSI